MAPAAPELAAIFRQHGSAYRAARGLPRQQLRTMQAIEMCRTAALGGHVDRCSRCDHTHIWYNSCRNRHCPKCQNLARAKWLGDRRGELLPVEYFHVVFTMPEEAASVAFYNPGTVYDVLFRAASETLLRIARDHKHLGAEIGFFAVLHSWGQNLLHHPHLHCVIPGGGICVGGQRWICCRPGFFLPVRVLSRLFRRLFIKQLQAAFGDGKLHFYGELADLAEPRRWRQYLEALERREWVVYSKPPFGGPQQVIEYLGRYTHRVAISNQRLVNIADGKVSFRWKDYRSKGRHKQRLMTLSAEEFIRRFLMHVLPPGFQRIRYFGFMANCHRRRRLAIITSLLENPATQLLPDRRQRAQRVEKLSGQQFPVLCPACGVGVLIRAQLLPPLRSAPVEPEDTS
jgi:Putative transposase/Transposase zinc-binding domain